METEYHKPLPQTYTRTRILRAALEYADEGIRVLLCKRGGKEPIYDKEAGLEHGHQDATTDKACITARLNRHPNANIGAPVPTDEVVIDIDRDRYGFSSFAELEERYGELPTTQTVETGRGGQHLRFKIPSGITVKSRPDAFGLMGVDVKAAGGYVLLPPSVTEGPYIEQESCPPADLPLAWLEALREPEAPVQGVGQPAPSTSAATVAAAGPIYEGTRDDTLTQIAGRLHDGTRTLTQLAADLMAINEERCEPPLPERQVEKIARSIHRREPCKATAPAPTPEALEIIESIEADLEAFGFSRQGEHTDYDFMVGLCRIARRHSTVTPAGARVEASIREVIEVSGIGSTKTGWTSINRLRASGWLRRDGTGSGPKRGAFILLRRAKVNTHPPGGSLENTTASSVSPCAPPRMAPRLRYSAPGQAGRLGKRRGRVIDVLENHGELDIDEMADALTGEDGKRPRPRDLKRRTLPTMLESRVVECVAGKYRLSAEWLAALNQRREEDGEIAAAEYQRREHKRQQERFAEAWKRGEVVSKEELARRRHRRRHPYRVQADHAPTYEEMYERREASLQDRREAIKAAVARLFRERPEYRERRVGQITCALVNYIGDDFPRGREGLPKDAEVEALLDGVAA